MFDLPSASCPQYCTVRVVPDQLMVFGGKADACAQASLMSIGRLGVEENKAHAAAIFEAVEKLLGVPQDRYWRSSCLAEGFSRASLVSQKECL